MACLDPAWTDLKDREAARKINRGEHPDVHPFTFTSLTKLGLSTNYLSGSVRYLPEPLHPRDMTWIDWTKNPAMVRAALLLVGGNGSQNTLLALYHAISIY